MGGLLSNFEPIRTASESGEARRLPRGRLDAIDAIITRRSSATRFGRSTRSSSPTCIRRGRERLR